MHTDRICYNGKIATPEQIGLRQGALTEAPAIYQLIHITGQRQVLHLETHLEIASQAYHALYPAIFAASDPATQDCASASPSVLSPASHTTPFPIPDQRLLQERIERLLIENRSPATGSCMRLLLHPYGYCSDEKSPCWMLDAMTPLYYSNYTIWHTRPLLDVMPCEYLFMGYPTTVSQQIAAYSRTVAAANGCGAAVIENFDQVLTNVEDEPLFLVFGHEVYTSPIECGATDSVMRRLIFEACRRKKIALHEEPLVRGMLTRCDEAFTGSVHGLISFDGYGPQRYFNIMVQRLIDAIY